MKRILLGSFFFCFTLAMANNANVIASLRDFSQSLVDLQIAVLPKPVLTVVDEQLNALSIEMNEIITLKFDTCTYTQVDISEYNELLQTYILVINNNGLSKDDYNVVEYSQRPYRVELDCLINIFDIQIKNQESIDTQMIQAYEASYKKYDQFMKDLSLVVDSYYSDWLNTLKQYQVQQAPVSQPPMAPTLPSDQCPGQALPEPVQEGKTLIDSSNITTGQAPQFYGFEEHPIQDTVYKIGIVKSNGFYDIKVYGPQLIGNVYVEDFYTVEKSGQYGTLEVAFAYPVQKIKLEEPVGKRIYTLAQGLRDELEEKRSQMNLQNWATEKTKLWDWKIDSLRKSWLNAIAGGKVYKGGSYNPVQSAKNTDDYFDNIEKMVNEKVLTVPHELKYVDYLYQVNNVLNLIVSKYQNTAETKSIKQLSIQVDQLKTDIERETNWVMRKLLRQFLDKAYAAQAGQQAVDKMLGQFGDDSDDESDDEWDDSDIEILS